MNKPTSIEARTALVLDQEIARMAACLERVRLVAKAYALRHGVRPTQIAQQDVDLFP